MSQTETVATQYGETTIEVVDCDSCGTTIAKDDAREFTLGDRDGWACQHCVENGPISFPERVREWAMPTDRSLRNNAGMVFYISMAFLLIPVGTVEGFRKDSSQFVEGYAAASVTYIIYLLVIGGLWYFL